MVIRPLKDDEDVARFTVIGTAYVHGRMDGEALGIHEDTQEREDC
jgi:hypothetical protein